MSDPHAIAFENVGKNFAAGSGAVAALIDVSLAVTHGEFVALTGPSGAGKSTLLHLVAGIDHPTSGRVLVGGEDLSHLSDDTRSDLRLRRVGIVFQSFNLFPTFTIEENVAWPLRFLGVGWRSARQRARRLLARLGIEEAAHVRLPAELAGGEQQRVAIARSLVTEPRILLADEPTGNLDSGTARIILTLLAHLNAELGLTILLVTHNPEAAAYADRVLALHDGRLSAAY